MTGVLLAGGSTRVPLVRRELEHRFGADKVRHDVDPMHCVALGAAFWNERFPMDSSGHVSLEPFQRTGITTAMDLGIEVFREGNPNAFTVMVPKGNPFPMGEPRRETFYPTAAHQRRIVIPIFQGNHALTTLNNCQGIIDYTLPGGLATNTPIKVGFRIDEHGVLTVTVDVVGHPGYSTTWEIKRNQAVLSRARRRS